MAYLDGMDYLAEELEPEAFEEFKQLYYEEYDYMYDNNDIPSDGFSYSEMLDLGDELIKAHMPLLLQFVRDRMDPLSSDREVAAFAIAVMKTGYVWFR